MRQQAGKNSTKSRFPVGKKTVAGTTDLTGNMVFLSTANATSRVYRSLRGISMKTVFWVLLSAAFLFAQEKRENVELPVENPPGKPVVLFAVSGGTSVLSAFLAAHGLYGVNHFHGAGADIGSGMEIVFSIPVAIASGVLWSISVHRYRRRKEWERQHSVAMTFNYTAVAQRSELLFSCDIPTLRKNGGDDEKR